MYDTRGRKTSVVDPNMGTWSYKYNGFGELIQQTDANAKVTTLKYDTHGRLYERVEAEGTTSWEYDTATRGSGLVWYRKLAKVTGPADRGYTYSESVSYKAAGLPSSTTRMIGGRSFTSSVTYDTYGRADKTIYPNNFVTKNEYSSNGFLRVVRDGRTALQSLGGLETPLGMIYWQADHYCMTGAVDGSRLRNGLSYDRLQVYFEVEGGLSKHYDCWSGRIEFLPRIIWLTEDREIYPNSAHQIDEGAQQ